VHLKIDTGMGRVGCSPQVAQSVAERLVRLPAIQLVALMTHFAESDAEDPTFTREQLNRLHLVMRELRQAGIAPALCHAANSAALIRHPEARLDLVRPGIMLYGCHPCAAQRTGDPALMPALRLRTAISHLADLAAGGSVGYGRTFVAPRDMRIATLPIGYADGLPRNLSGLGQVLIQGRRVPIVGRVCMDMTMVDVTQVPAVRLGDEAVCIGRQGPDEITAEEVARLAGTISYEILCRIGPRVPRVYTADSLTLRASEPVSCGDPHPPNLLDNPDAP
jgi:alanine racemase